MGGGKQTQETAMPTKPPTCNFWLRLHVARHYSRLSQRQLRFLLLRLQYSAKDYDRKFERSNNGSLLFELALSLDIQIRHTTAAIKQPKLDSFQPTVLNGRATGTVLRTGRRVYEKSIGSKMDYLDLCLEVVSRLRQVVNHCVTFDVEYLGNRQRQRLGSKEPIRNDIWGIKWSRDHQLL